MGDTKLIPRIGLRAWWQFFGVPEHRDVEAGPNLPLYSILRYRASTMRWRANNCLIIALVLTCATAGTLVLGEVRATTMSGLPIGTVALTLSYRIATMLLVVYLARILLGVYRYCMRMGAFYSSLADSLHFVRAPTEDISFEVATKVFSINALFEEPKNPSDDALEVINTAARLAENLRK